jgi:TolB-like protein/Tfp pilus assembly protein PilF
VTGSADRGSEHQGLTVPSGKVTALLHELARAPGTDAPPPAAPELMPGTTIGRFELVRVLGRGGFGVVYEARDRQLGRSVAFKLLKPGTRPYLAQESLLREAELAARLSHPNIVTLYDVGQGAHGPYLVLELLSGETLASRLQRGPLPLAEALRVAVAVARGLAHAHQHGVIHRDVKPGNIFLCEDGQVKVLDLGMAHAFGHRNLEGGTTGYMAPEQRRGAPEDERTDVYALGVVLHVMLTGHLPHPGLDWAAHLVPVALVTSKLPALRSVVASMLEPDPVRRPRDAGEVLVALLLEASGPEGADPGNVGPHARGRRPRQRRTLVASAVVATLVAGALAAVLGSRFVRAPRLGPARPAPIRAIAVLPFKDLSPGKDQEYFAEGLAEEILGTLARIQGLRVPSRTSSFYFKDKNVRIEDIGRELRVGAILEGSVRRDGNRIRVRAQVVNVEDGFRSWGETYDRDLNDVFAVQQDIARAVAAALDQKLVEGGPPTVTGDSTASPEAYTQYLMGRQHFNRMTEEGDRRAAEAFRRAVELDPHYALAWAGRARTTYSLSVAAATPADAEGARRRALEEAERAVSLAPTSATTLSTRGLLRARISRDWEGALSDLDRAVHLPGADSEAHRSYFTVLLALGRMAEATTEAYTALDLDPVGPSWISMGGLLMVTGRLDEAEAAYRRHLQLEPRSEPARFGLSRTLLLKGRPDEALQAVETSLECWRLWTRARVSELRGDAPAARSALEALTAKYGDAHPTTIAELHAERGDLDSAFLWLERSVVSSDGQLVTALETDVFLRNVRADPRYPALLARLGLPLP